jgi:hypothetical protein
MLSPWDNLFFWVYLHDRAQFVSVGGKFSSWLGVNSDVPQSSILGSFFFSVYINDIGGNLKYCRHHLMLMISKYTTHSILMTLMLR